ncbi:flagellar hook-associated protein FlgK [Desulfovibrio sp. X2]|uniref:flagellar hook-associated protein FlgK n=1 Tax=Desulfovibrio sp. X2 TaxID=941449 RepID=UPI000358E55E|nr:flagellar hook-associated protein FlgK [Desulfovibrio sp. X2]EPR41707.1 flagellar hook-associated protein FlgK [Desulfovibrio sp. X2]
MSVNSLLGIGQSGIFASQSSIQTVGNNIANVDTPGYHRRTVELDEAMSINGNPGQIGTGVLATQVVRSFDQFVENTYNTKASDRDRWNSLNTELKGLDSLFNESNQDGLNAALSGYFSAWNDLAAAPDSYPAREALLSKTQVLTGLLNSADAQMASLQKQTDSYISQDVTTVNDLTTSIAALNKQINEQDIPGVNNVNELYDKRDSLVRQLAEKIDITYVDNGGGNVTILTRAGQPLVDGAERYEIKFEGPKSFNDLTPDSNFDGKINFSGDDDYEYTFQVVQGGSVNSGASAAMMKVSLDGGKTWLKDDDGNTLLVPARPDDGKITVRGLKIWFGTADNSQATPSNDMEVGDTFTVVPKKGLYWYQNTSSFVNITPQTSFTGQADDSRVTGGSLAGYFNFRDDYVGNYRDKLDAFSKTLVWETNRIHSQGAGLDPQSSLSGTYGVDNDAVALGSGASGLAFADKLSSGTSMVYLYDAQSGALVSSAALDFDPSTPGQQNFDPDTNTLQDVCTALNNAFPGKLSAQIVNHRLQIHSADGSKFELGEDTTGLWAALGINTFLDGSNAEDVSFNTNVTQDLAHINAGHVNGAGEANTGDNTTAASIVGLETKNVDILTLQAGKLNETMSSFYNSLVAEVGSDTEQANFNFTYQKALADDLDRRQQEASGVNLDQELSDLIKFQHSYTAAAKLITTADQMIQTLLAIKQ